MNSHRFIENLKTWSSYKHPPAPDSWPDEFLLPKQANYQLDRLRKFTDTNNHEYESVFAFAGYDGFMSNPYKGTRYSVSAGHSMTLDFGKKSGTYIQRIIKIDGYEVSRDMIRLSDIDKTKELGFLFSIHSHPKQRDKYGKIGYSFFSEQDLETLRSSESLVLGLVTDEVWFASKDRRIERIRKNALNDIFGVMRREQIIFTHDSRLIYSINELRKCGFEFYRGKIGDLLRKV